jgi:hypothetical protein
VSQAPSEAPATRASGRDAVRRWSKGETPMLHRFAGNPRSLSDK